ILADPSHVCGELGLLSGRPGWNQPGDEKGAKEQLRFHVAVLGIWIEGDREVGQTVMLAGGAVRPSTVAGALNESGAYASLPCSTTSSPLISSSAGTRRPTVALTTLKKTNMVVKVQRNAATIPMSCVVMMPIEVPPALNRPAARVPHTPQTPCTEIAPTGSSIRIRSKNSTEKTTTVPAISPMTMAAPGTTFAHPAVMPTR